VLPAFGKKMKNGQVLMNHLFRQPIVDSSDVAEILAVNAATAHRLIGDFISSGILHEITGYRRNRVFVFKEYLDLFR
jgi:Fic family protein